MAKTKVNKKDNDVDSETVANEATNFAETLFGHKEVDSWDTIKGKTERLRKWLDSKVGTWLSGFIVGTLNMGLIWFINTKLPDIRKRFGAGKNKKEKQYNPFDEEHC